MSNETKLIIITSDEDLIRRISSTNNDKTRIIDLDDDLSKDDHSMALSYLAELSPLVFVVKLQIHWSIESFFFNFH